MRATLAALVAVGGLAASVGLSVALSDAIPLGMGLVLASALGLSAVFDGVAAVAVERRWRSAGWLLLTLIAGGSTAAAGILLATAVIIESAM